MKLRTRQFIALAALLITLGVRASGDQGGGIIRREEPQSQGREVERSSVNLDRTWRPGGTGATRVIGSVIDIRQMPVPQAKIQLRNLNTGNVEQTTESDESGEYGFELEESGTYVVEMIMVDGAVLALSNAGSISRFETLNTVVQLPGRWDSTARLMIPMQNVSSFLGLSGATSMTSTTIEIATEQNIRPQDPGVPLSPS